ncbi:unnamed protein product [Bodo saltans]|uniref:Uncharacterized protein n=1 Tax=Bodo saltans TaxID=75058 RepID=A0A0S4J5R3_BODSA|nr:unnamed protein product [Bodo saltans]|eukprot:CUG59468.1 unnamed protein product [Bodo saltans]
MRWMCPSCHQWLNRDEECLICGEISNEARKHLRVRKRRERPVRSTIPRSSQPHPNWKCYSCGSWCPHSSKCAICNVDEDEKPSSNSSSVTSTTSDTTTSSVVSTTSDTTTSSVSRIVSETSDRISGCSSFSCESQWHDDDVSENVSYGEVEVSDVKSLSAPGSICSEYLPLLSLVGQESTRRLPYR